MYRVDYAEKSSSRGVLGEDVISFGSKTSLKPQRLIFGCENMESGQLYTQHADGIIGLGSAKLGIMNQLVKKGAIDDSFSLCYGGMDQTGGMMVLGNVPPPKDMVYSHYTPGRRYNRFSLSRLSIFFICDANFEPAVDFTMLRSRTYLCLVIL